MFMVSAKAKWWKGMKRMTWISCYAEDCRNCDEGGYCDLDEITIDGGLECGSYEPVNWEGEEDDE